MSSSEEESDTNSREIIDPGPHCICRGPDIGTFMICCDNCEVWYHGKCIGLKNNSRAELIDKFICHVCLGTSTEESIERAIKESKRQKLPPKPTQPPPVAYVKKSLIDTPKPTKRKSPNGDSTKVKSNEIKKKKFEENHDEEKIEKKRKAVTVQIFTSLNKGYLADKEKLDDPYVYSIESEETLKALASEIENAMFDEYEGIGKQYMEQFKILRYNLSVASNIKLRNQVITKKIKVGELVKMSNEDMAPENVISFRREKEELSLEARLKESEDEKPLITTVNPELVQEEVPPQTSRPVNIVEEEEENNELKSSSSSITKILESPRKSIDLTANHTKIIKPEVTLNNKLDIKVEDHHIEEEDEDNMLIGWRGNITYKGVCEEFRTIGYHVNGGRYDAFLKNVEEFAQKERVDKTKILKYLSELESSTTRTRSIMRLEPESILDKELYTSLFNHLNNLNRAGVVVLDGPLKDNIFKEIYIFPIKGDPDILSELPSFIPRHLVKEGKDRLFVAFVVDKRKAASLNEEKASTTNPDISFGNQYNNYNFNENKSNNIPTSSTKVGHDPTYGHPYQPVFPHIPMSVPSGNYGSNYIPPVYTPTTNQNHIGNFNLNPQQLENLKKMLNLNKPHSNE